MSSMLIVGFGYLGKAIAMQTKQHHKTYIIKRNQAPLPPYVRPFFFDITHTNEYPQLPSVDTLYYTVSANQRTKEAYLKAYIDGLTTLISQLKQQQALPKHFVFVSSTSVYHQNNGATVDETSATQPTKYQGQIMLQAEQIVKELNLKKTIARFSGIYGPKRCAFAKKLQQGTSFHSADKLRITNHIHVDDGARALLHLSQLSQPPECVNVSDPNPRSIQSLLECIQPHTKQALQKQENNNNQQPLSNKSVSCELLLQTGFKFQHPDFSKALPRLICELSDEKTN
jgi:nucleoside-diphosphate-sugar epimerase